MRVSSASNALTSGVIKSGTGIDSSAARLAAMLRNTRVDMVARFIWWERLARDGTLRILSL
jgi:hypothetical protein